MLGYTRDDFFRYFRHAYIKTPVDNYPRQLLDMQGDLCILKNIKANPKQVQVDFNQLTWDLVKFPKLGYRNSLDGGKGLYFVQAKVGRITSKGLSDQTVSVFTVEDVTNAISFIGLDRNRYLDECCITSQLASAIFEPEFVPLDTAVKQLGVKADATGYAINEDVALVLGTKKRTPFKLLWKQIEVAVSEDGRAWKIKSKEYADSLARSIGALNYVN